MALKNGQKMNRSNLFNAAKRVLKHISHWFKRHPRTTGLIVVLAVVLLFDVITPFGGQLRFYAKWIECGGRPYATAGWIWNTAGISHYEPAPTFMVDRGGFNPYFCTPKEAELAGYSASEYQYDYPNLSTEEMRTMWDNRKDR